MFYWFLRILVLPFYRLIYRQKVYGRENLPKDGKVIIIGNHYSKADVFMMSTLYRKKVFFLAKKEWFSSKFKSWFFKKLGGIPVDREKADLASLKNCLKTIRDGKTLVVFPEGTRNKTADEDLLPLKGGASFIAYLSKTPVVPVAMSRKFRPFRKNYVYIGEKFDFSEFKDRKFNAETSDETTEIMRGKLLDALYNAREKEKSKGKRK